MDSGVNVYDETWLTLTVSNNSNLSTHRVGISIFCSVVQHFTLYLVEYTICTVQNTYNKRRGVFSHYFRDCYGFTLFKEDR